MAPSSRKDMKKQSASNKLGNISAPVTVCTNAASLRSGRYGPFFNPLRLTQICEVLERFVKGRIYVALVRLQK
jgi:hypothetical protein